jgi:hypothetical protein
LRALLRTRKQVVRERSRNIQRIHKMWLCRESMTGAETLRQMSTFRRRRSYSPRTGAPEPID